MTEQEREYILYFYDGSVRRVTGKLSELQKLPVSRIEKAPNLEGSRKMPEQKIPPAVVIIPIGLGLGLVAALGAFALARAARVGFTLGIVNPPPGANLWTALFYNEPQIWSPVLELDELWDYPDDPQGRADLMVRVFDADLYEIFHAINLGPIEKEKNYVYDCASG